MSRDSARARLDQVINVLKTPSGFGRLNPNQKRFLFGVVLSSVVPSDMVVRPSEQQKLKDLFDHFLHLHGEAREDAVTLSELPPLTKECMESLGHALSDLLGVQDRALFVRHLWELALSDGELHSDEEKLIFRISDAAGIPRKQVAEQLAWVSAQT